MKEDLTTLELVILRGMLSDRKADYTMKLISDQNVTEKETEDAEIQDLIWWKLTQQYRTLNQKNHDQLMKRLSDHGIGDGTATKKEIKEVIYQVEEGALLSDYNDMTLRQILSDYENVPGYTVMWGCWSDKQLDTVFHHA